MCVPVRQQILQMLVCQSVTVGWHQLFDWQKTPQPFVCHAPPGWQSQGWRCEAPVDLKHKERETHQLTIWPACLQKAAAVWRVHFAARNQAVGQAL
jgi:hypothetical protein